MELEEQVLRNEAQGSVLRSPDLVPDELLFPVTLLILLFRWQRHVHENVSGLGAFVVLLNAHWTIFGDMAVVLIVVAALLFIR